MNYYKEYKPTLMQRVWRRLGFRTFEVPLSPSDEARIATMNGWVQCVTRLRLDISDRLRVLVSGKVDVRATIHTEHDAGEAVTETRITFVPPGRQE